MLFTSRLSSHNSFPHPLSPEKEKEYLRKFQEEGDKEARDILIKHNLRLVAFIAKKYANYPDPDELISVGTMGLMKAVNTYQGGKGTQLATYASRCIENEILMTMRAYKKTASNVSLYESIGSDKDGNQLTLIDLLSLDEESVYSALERTMLRETLLRLIEANLGAREKEIIIARYGFRGAPPETQQAVASRLGISRSYVSRLENKALNELKGAIEREGIDF